MKFKTLFLTVLFLALNVSAGPLVNSAEREGDKKLTAAQQTEYKRLLDEGVQHFEAGDLQKAERSFSDILKFAPKKPAAYYNLGLVKYREGQYQAAIENFDQVIKMRSLYTGSAIYYKAIAQYNLGLKDEALKTAKRYTETRYFFQPSQRLIQAIQKDSDPYFEVATSAFASQNYELCLLSLNDSVIGDSPKGKAIEKQCREAMAAGAGAPSDQPVGSETAGPRRWQLFASLRLSHSDNIAQANTNQESKNSYYASIGGEYIVNTPVQIGLGAGYEHYNVIDLPAAKNESLNVYIPVLYGWDQHHLQGQLFYTTNRVDGDEDTSDTGLSASYSYTPDNWLLGLTGYWSQKTSLNAISDYKAGPMSSSNLNILRFMDQWTFGLTAGLTENRGGDIPFGATFLPNAAKTVNYSLNASYALNITSKFSGKISRADSDFMNVYSVNGTDRHDVLTQYALTYLHSFDRNLNAYVQQMYSANDSNYDGSEIINKNYNENSTSLGLSYTY